MAIPLTNAPWSDGDEFLHTDANEISSALETVGGAVAAHLADTANPHSVTKAQVGLGSVGNYAMASQAEAEAGTEAAKFMSPLRTAQAIAALGGGGGGGGVGSVIYVRKTSNESVTANTTLQDDDHLFFAIGANEVYFIQYWLKFDAPTATDFKIAIVTPWLATGWMGGPRISDAVAGPSNVGMDFSSTDVIDGTAERYFGGIGAGGLSITPFQAFVMNGANAGTVQLQWAQKASGGTAAILKTDSLLIATRLA